MKIHGGAGAGRDDDREVSGEYFGTVAGDFARGIPIAGIKSGLAAAGLVFGKLDGDSEMLKDFNSGLGGFVVEGIAEAGAHEEDSFVGRSLELNGHEDESR